MACCGLTFMQVFINFIKTMLAIDTLMQWEGLPFSASDLLNVYTVVRPKQEPNTNLFTRNHYLRLKNSRQPWSRLITANPNKDLYLDEFVWISRNLEFHLGDDGWWSFPKTNGNR